VSAFSSYVIDNDLEFQQALDRLSKTVSDFRIPFGQISRHFYQGNKRIFSLKSAGGYPDFKTEKSRQQKISATEKLTGTGFDYPLLVRTGRLAASLFSKGDPEAVNVITERSLMLGTNVPYAIYHQSDKPRKVLPQRKVIFIDGGPLDDSKSKGRREAWLNIVNTHVLKVVGAKWK